MTHVDASPASGPLPTPAPVATPIPPPTPTPVPVTWAPGAPNIIFIVTDDMTVGMVKYMSELQDLLIDQGASFDNFFVTTPLCCPARSTILTGQYAHNHGVHHNSNALDNGGFNAFFRTGREASTIATALDAAGYETALFGKYLNGYALKGAENYVPPGWDEWYAFTTRRYYYNSTLNENGTLVDYGGQPSDYSTDVLTTKTVDFVRRQATKPGPFRFRGLQSQRSWGEADPSTRAFTSDFGFDRTSETFVLAGDAAPPLVFQTSPDYITTVEVFADQNTAMRHSESTL